MGDNGDEWHSSGAQSAGGMRMCALYVGVSPGQGTVGVSPVRVSG